MVLVKEMESTETFSKPEADDCLADVESGDDCEETKGSNDAWADAMGRILGKRVPDDPNKSVILAKNKQKDEENKQERVEQRERKRLINKKRKWEEMNYCKPDPLQKDYERGLQKIATRGVVQLFNAVKKHQAEIDKKMKAVKTESKREQIMKSVSKGDFMDMLKSDNKKTKGSSKKEANEIADKEDEKKWDVLRDDYMMGTKLKDWDKESDGE